MPQTINTGYTHTAGEFNGPMERERGEQNRQKMWRNVKALSTIYTYFLSTLLAKIMSQWIDCESLFKDYKMNVRFYDIQKSFGYRV